MHPSCSLGVEAMTECWLMRLVGFLFDATLAAAHLVLSGVPERFPRIRWVLAHLGGAIPYLMHLTGDMFSLGIKFSAPVLAVLMLTGLVLGIMARIFPQLNVFMLSFPINIGASFLVIGLTLGLVTSLLGREFHGLAAKFFELLRLLAAGH